MRRPSGNELRECVQHGIIHFGSHIEGILTKGKNIVELVRNSEHTRVASVLLYGPTKSGKTALAATMALASEFPFIKLISPEMMIGLTESEKIAAINKVFNDAYKTPLSVIVIDSIERLIDWSPVGHRYSNAVLQTILVLIKKNPPKGHRLVILGTTTAQRVLDDLDLSDEFGTEINVPAITSLEALDKVVQELKLFTNNERQKAMELLSEGFMSKNLNIGIKRLLMISEMAKQDADKVETFVYELLMPSSSVYGACYQSPKSMSVS